MLSVSMMRMTPTTLVNQVNKAAERLLFDEDEHRYSLDGVPVPNVTNIIKPLSSLDRVPAHVLARAAERGKAVHKACELHLLGDLDEASLDDEIAPYFYQFLRFLRESGFKPEMSERKVFSEKHRYAGTLDLFGALSRKAALVDIKTPIIMYPATGPQLSAYENAMREIDGIPARKIIHRYGLKLQPDHYELVPFTNPGDFSVFLAMKVLYHWKETHA